MSGKGVQKQGVSRRMSGAGGHEKEVRSRGSEAGDQVNRQHLVLLLQDFQLLQSPPVSLLGRLQGGRRVTNKSRETLCQGANETTCSISSCLLLSSLSCLNSCCCHPDPAQVPCLPDHHPQHFLSGEYSSNHDKIKSDMCTFVMRGRRSLGRGLLLLPHLEKGGMWRETRRR